jgi:hypothetical protein
MANQTSTPSPNDVADERGRITPGEMPGEPPMAPDNGIDAAATHESSGDTATTRQTGTQGAVIEDLTDPDADANCPDPSKPVSMSTMPQAQPDRGRDIPGGGYGDSRDIERADRAIDDETAGAGDAAAAGIRSGSHVTEDDTKGVPPGSRSGAEHSRVSQPANVNEPRP